MKVRDLLLTHYPDELVDLLIGYFQEIERNYRLEKWKPSELDSGHFVEVVRRVVEYQLFGSYAPLDKSMGSFNSAVLTKYESAKGDESYRVIIPRVMYAMYCVRNKRGVGHVGPVSPNKMDATFVLSSAKWILAELVRLSGRSHPDNAHSAIDELMDKHVDLIWADDEIFMILDRKMKAADKALLALYKEDGVSIEVLRDRVVYQNKTNFLKILKNLENKKLIHLTKQDTCKLSPLGVKTVEERLKADNSGTTL